VGITDDDFLEAEYADEAKLIKRRRSYEAHPRRPHEPYRDGPDAQEVLLERVAAVRPRRVLDAGCGTGALGRAIAGRTGAAVAGVDRSQRMVDLSRAAGLDAHLGDVRSLPFANAQFDCVVAAWMLYHVDDVPLALAELARVLAPGGTFFAVTGTTIPRGPQLMDLFSEERAPRQLSFSAENGEALLGAHFGSVERVDVEADLVYPDRESIRRRLLASMAQAHRAADVPELDEPYGASTFNAIFVARR
jgi:ubiquinone/menaquinone biosynthesis C-methylase UbiE